MRSMTGARGNAVRNMRAPAAPAYRTKVLLVAWRGSKARAPLTNAAGKVGIRVGSLRRGIDERLLFELRETQASRGQSVTLKEHFVPLPVEEHAPIPGRTLVGSALGPD